MLTASDLTSIRDSAIDRARFFRVGVLTVISGPINSAASPFVDASGITEACMSRRHSFLQSGSCRIRSDSGIPEASSRCGMQMESKSKISSSEAVCVR